jgi:putative spermidine/putrescine transport system permease protein
LSIPLSVAHIVVVLLVVVMFGSSGIFARVLYAMGVIDSAQSLPSVIGAFSGWGIILVFMFKEIPYITLCTVTLMANIGDRYSEAALSLGASPLRTFFTITLPLCKNPIIRASLVVFAFAFGSYEIPYLLGTSSPRTIAVLAFYEFQNNSIVNRSYAMTLVTIMIVITLVVAIVYFILLNRESKESASE